MARIRTVKPELFLHEELYGLEEATGLPIRLAWIGLFTVADREGRFKWQPNILKLHVLPWDTVDFNLVIKALKDSDFIRQYEVDGKLYGFIPSFNKHQRVRTDEAESVLPAPPNIALVKSPSLDRDEPVTVESPIHVVEMEGKGKEGNGNTANPKFDFERVYSEYPRKEGKQEGVKVCKVKIKTLEEYEALLGAVRRYRAHCEREGIDKKYIKHFSTFMNGGKWRDWLEPETGTGIESNPGSHIDWSKFS